MMISTMSKNPILIHVDTELNIAICRVGRDDIVPWMRRSRTVSRNVCQFVGMYDGL